MIPRRLTIVLLVTLTLCVSLEAMAFVCSRGKDENDEETGPSLSWFTRSITYHLSFRGTEHIEGSVEHDVLHQAFGVWNERTMSSTSNAECGELVTGTDVYFFPARSLSTSTFVGYDRTSPDINENLLLFRDTAWLADPEEGNYTLALTTVTYEKSTGEILDADIEFNTAEHPYVARQAAPEGLEVDLMNTAVHEIGHVLGLAHSFDVEATMYLEAPEGDIAKRDLECDDVMGMVFKYPAGKLNNYCAAEITMACGLCAPPEHFDDNGGVILLEPSTGIAGCACATAHATQAGWATWALLLLVFRLRGKSRLPRNPSAIP